MTAPVTVTAADRIILADLFDLPQEQAMKMFAGDYDDKPNIMGKLQVIAAFRQQAEAASKAREDALVAELSAMTEHYVQLAGCGDCGFWNPEEEERVISARALLARAKASSDGGEG